MVPHAAFAGALSLFARHAAEGDAESYGNAFDIVVSGFAVVAGLVLAAGATPLLVALYGPAFAAAAPALIWVGLGMVPSLVNAARKVRLYAVGRENVALHWSAVTLVLQVVMCAVLATRSGAAGVAVAMAAGEAAVWWPIRRAALGRTTSARASLMTEAALPD
jgi:O-antigen/teichoic acid export membrane protein